MLTEMFGMAWYEVHDEAGRLEHACNPLVPNSPDRRLRRRENTRKKQNKRNKDFRFHLCTPPCVDVVPCFFCAFARRCLLRSAAARR